VSATTPEDRPPRLAFGMYKRFVLGALIVVLSTSAAVATAALLEVKSEAGIFFRNSSGIHGIKGALDGVDAGGPQTILILGSDRRFADIKAKTPVRSDTIILLRLDPSKGATAVMSLPRDLKVSIPGHGTDKINAAYAIGGPALSVKTIRKLLGIPINHVINVNFGGFRRAVDRLGCVYTDVDRRYFNDNSPPFGGGGNYATIDVKAGYQKLCGQDALDFVRYRHFDTDLVRAARQQQFLSDAKDQIGVGKVFSDRKALLKIFGRYTQTDISSTNAILRLLKLAVESAQKPVQEVSFPGDITGDFVTVTPEHLAVVKERFMNAKGTKGPRGKVAGQKPVPTKRPKRSKHSSKSSALAPGLQPAGRAGEDEAVQLATKLPFAVYYPKAVANGSSLLNDHSRAYDIFDRNRQRHRAYRMVIKAPGLGQYYGVQGTDWTGPPILDNPSERRKLGGRTFELFFDGDRLRLVAWRSGKGVYWISNTLLHSLTNQQMLGLARSVSKIS
jgi:polyisoprenyl-teichoic acid--peptidoglycan teichoic acid transferase